MATTDRRDLHPVAVVALLATAAACTPDFHYAGDDEAPSVAAIERARVLPELRGRRLDGVEESVGAYRGRVLLIDVWATWCRPCVDALPELRALVAELPADRFALLAISVDGALETVTDLMEREPMPWHNWHVGMGSEAERILGIQSLPTYLLVDEEGVVLATEGPLVRLRCMAERALAGEDPQGCTPANWWLPGGWPPAVPSEPTQESSDGW
ncbi:MAG: TlpA disulfide reductase family protein [Acidobacteria bacterium]|nr:TlpA disulfide reductase family protein [Acidobacteriota bacterium]